MADTSQSRWHGYAISLGAAIAALLFTRFFLEPKTPFLPCLATVLIISWRFGQGPGYLAAAVLAAFTSYGLINQTPSMSRVEFWRFFSREAMFMFVAWLTILIANSQHKAQASAREQSDLLRF